MGIDFPHRNYSLITEYLREIIKMCNVILDKTLCEKSLEEVSPKTKTQKNNIRTRKRNKRKKLEKNLEKSKKQEESQTNRHIFSQGDYKSPKLTSDPEELRKNSVGWGMAYWNEDNEKTSKDGDKTVTNQLDNIGSNPSRANEVKRQEAIKDNLPNHEIKRVGNCTCPVLIELPGGYPCSCGSSKLTDGHIIKTDIEKIFNEPPPELEPPIQPQKVNPTVQDPPSSKWISQINDCVLAGLDPVKSHGGENRDNCNRVNGSSGKMPYSQAANSRSVNETKFDSRVSQGNSTNQDNRENDNNGQKSDKNESPITKKSISSIVLNKVRSIALFVLFDENMVFVPEIDELHQLGFHPIIRMVPPDCHNYTNTKEFIIDVALNCWANGWRIVLFVSTPNSELHDGFIRILREIFLKLTLDIIVIRNTNSSYRNWRYYEAGVSAVIVNSKKEAIMHVLSSTDNQISRTEGVVKFYEKYNNYYEFTNFYLAPIIVDGERWPSTEHYSSKFEDKYQTLRERIRTFIHARDAFRTAREYDKCKRSNWEMPLGNPFKEEIMRKALKCKFTQHENLKYLILSTGTARIYEHTINDRYWGDGGPYGGGLNRLGVLLEEVRYQLMLNECLRMSYKYANRYRWMVPELHVLFSLEDI
ncbi:14167_t:CDS:2 [Acaulospora colombiana]|uniref:14167_t:CDS:1 n=1 Tax=Acaulospora colombiana TaxID=27376 RepID=A0ACA9KPP2_9GLOM|nr:14167_t:CDS:2 [Acaulospora colombiana]